MCSIDNGILLYGVGKVGFLYVDELNLDSCFLFSRNMNIKCFKDLNMKF